MLREQTILLNWVLLGFAVIILLGLLGWLMRRRRQRSIPVPERVPADIGTVRLEVEGLYVSTTLDGQPLNRVAVRGLGFRARASIAVADLGVVLALPGNTFFIPREAIREVTRGQYTIDRVVEEGGLAIVAWTLGDAKIDTYLRVDKTRDLVEAIGAILPASTTSNPNPAGEQL